MATDLSSLRWATVPQADFSTLGNLQKTFLAARREGNRDRALADIDANNPQSLATLGVKLLQAGDTQGGFAAAQLARQNSNDDFERQYKTGMLGVAQQNAARRDTTIDQQVEQRRAAAAKLGLDPSNPAYNSFVLTGKMPREDQAPLTATDKKAILDADEAVLQNEAAIKALSEAKKLSPQANSGYFASARATLGNNLPDIMVPDRVSSPESSAATANYENLVLGQALSSLKSIFGAAPTEGERKILIDLQASVGKPDNVRQDILARAQALAEKRLEFNKQRAGELRGGTFYKPQGGQRAAPQGGPVRINSQQERDALDPGTPYIAPDGSLRTKQ